MITIAKTLLGLSALVSAGAVTVVASEVPGDFAPTPAPILSPTIEINGKVVNRLPSAADERIANAEAVARIRMAHGLDAPKAGAVDCRLHSLPRIPTECLTTADGPAPRRPARLIGEESH